MKFIYLTVFSILLFSFQTSRATYKENPFIYKIHDSTLKCLEIDRENWDDATLVAKKIRKIVYEDRCRFPYCSFKKKGLSANAIRTITSLIKDVADSKNPNKMFALKSILTRNEDFNLLTLLYDLIKIESRRNKIIDYLRLPFNDLTRDQKRYLIISDIDDTLLPSLHDKQSHKNNFFKQIIFFILKKKHLSPYKGVIDLYNKISCNFENLILLSARSSSLFFLKHLTYHTFDSIDQSDDPVRPLIFFNKKIYISKHKMAKGKEENMKHILKIFPEYKFLFFGDNGQGDLIFAKKMQNYFERIYIHDIFAKKSTNDFTLLNEKIVIFKNYNGVRSDLIIQGYIPLLFEFSRKGNSN